MHSSALCWSSLLVLASCGEQPSPAGSHSPSFTEAVLAPTLSTTVAPHTALSSSRREAPRSLDGDSAEYRAGYVRGAAEAAQEFENGSARIRVYGMRVSSDTLDRETGLNVIPLAGCIVDDEIKGRAAGYNEVITKLIEDHGAPPYSRKRWERELYNLGGYLSSLTGKDALLPLHIGGRGVPLRGGKMVVSMSPQLHVYAEGAPIVWTDRWGNRSTTADFIWSTVPKRIEVADGPTGSDVLIFRSTFADKTVEHAVLDLRSGEWLRQETAFP